MDASFALPVDTFSIALTNAPKSIPVLSNIYKLATDIRETKERVQVNKLQCEQLSERIDTLIGFLASRDLSECLNDAMHIALNRFETLLRQCLDFINTFIETPWLKRILYNKDHEKKFLDLNRELTQYSNDLNFGIGLSNLQGKKTNDKSDREENVSDQIRGKSPQQGKTSQVSEIRPYTAVVEKKASKPDSRDILHGKTAATLSSNDQQQAQEAIFVSGIWYYQYFQYDQWFGPFQHQIVFNPLNRTFTGYGEDNVGQYVLSGAYSEATSQIEMTQCYQIGTGNPYANIGHREVMRFNWNPTRRVFEGTSNAQMVGAYASEAPVEMWRV